MKNTRKIGIVSGIVLLSLIMFSGLGWITFRFWPTKEVSAQTTLVQQQTEVDTSLKDITGTFHDPQVIVNPYKISPLTALVMFKTDQPEAVTVSIEGKDKLTSFVHKFPATTEHRLPIYGLYAGKENKVIMYYGEEINELSIKTGPLPADMPKVLNITKDTEKLTDDLYFMTGSAANARTMAFDVNGDVRWWLDGKFSWEMKRLANGNLLLGGNRLMAKPYYMANMYEMNLLGKIYQEYLIPGGYHHDYYEMKNGNLVIAVNNITRQTGTTVEDTIVELDRKTGKIVKTIDLSEILPRDEGKSLDWSAGDWFHNNSVDLNEATGELILSGRHQDSVVNIDYSSGKLNYIIGSPDSWSDKMKSYFFTPVGEPFEWQWEQHAATFLPNGDIMLFDNGTHRSKNKETALPANKNYSRAVIYRIDKSAKTIRQIWQYGKEHGSEYFSPYISDADYLGENHVLVHSGGVSYKDGVVQNGPASLAKSDTLNSFTTEVLNDEVIFEIKVNTNFYRAEKMPLYTDKDVSQDIKSAKTLGQLAESAKQRWEMPRFSVRPLNQTYRDADVTFAKESERLIIKGKFHENDVVQLVLTNGTDTWRHRVALKSEVFSNAACIDITGDIEPEGERVEVEHYFNSTGLSGNYDIYLQFNGKIYQTGYHVKF